jgi:hypothetical protein
VNAFLAHAPVAWYVARAAGLVAFGFLTLSVWLGLAMSTRLLGNTRQKLHFRLASVLVPFASPWRPGAVAAGVVAGWLTLMLAASFRMRNRIGQKGWRRLHYASFAAFFLALGHALTSGTDLQGGGGPILGALAAGPVIWLTIYRILMPKTTGRAQAVQKSTVPVARSA